MGKIALRTIAFSGVVGGIEFILMPALLLRIDGYRFDATWLRWVGLLPLALGATLVIWCDVGFVVQGRGTPAPFDPPQQLVTGHLYSRVRNPIFLGATSLLVGEAVFFESHLILGYAAFMWLAWHVVVVAYEEPSLRRRFGTAYDQYAGRTPRWIPRLSVGGHAHARGV